MSSRSWSALVAVAVLCGLSADGSTRLVGTLEKDMSLTASGNPHVVTGTVTIPEGITVKAGPGVVFTGEEQPILVVESQGRLGLLGAKGKEIVLKGVSVRCGTHATLLATYCQFHKPEDYLVLRAGRGTKVWVRESQFTGCTIRLVADGGDMRLTHCRFGSSALLFRFPHGIVGIAAKVEDCTFEECTVDLPVLVAAKRCGFSRCRFPWEQEGKAVARRVMLQERVAVRTCVFCDESWRSVEEALQRASFPSQRMTVERAKSLKE